MENRSITKALAAEFIGTFALVFTIIFVIAMYATYPGPDGSAASVVGSLPNGLAFPFIALAHGLVLLVLIQTLGAISGGHFNPAITLGLLSIKKITVANAISYVFVQFAGAIAAALLALATIKGQSEAVNYGATTVSDQISVGSAIVLEAVFTFVLVWAVVGTAVNPDGPREWAPLVIAAALALGVLLIAPLTGAGLNPARSFGPALISGEWGSIGDFLLAYVVGPVAGGVLAAQLYSGLYLAPDRARRRPKPPAPSEQSPL